MSVEGRINLPPDCARRYEAVRVLGRGGFGAAVLAFDRELKRSVVIKLLFGAEPEMVARFVREARLTSQLNHENVVKVLDHAADGAVPWIAYEYVDGRTLRQMMDAGRVPLLQSLEIVRQVARALAAAHAHGVVHRDVKPENVLEESGQCLRLIDFGIAKGGTGRTVDTKAGMVMGSPGYLAPEMLRGDEVDARADLYSLGVVFFELLAGRPPFVASSALQVMAAHVNEPAPSVCRFAPECPASVEALVARCLTKLPADRVSSAAELVESLTRCINALQADDAPTQATRFERLRTSSTPHPTRASRTTHPRATRTATPATPTTQPLAGAAPSRRAPARRSRAWIAVLAGGVGAAVVAAVALNATRVTPPGPAVPSAAPSASPSVEGMDPLEVARVTEHMGKLYERISARTQSRISAAGNVVSEPGQLLGNPVFGLPETAIRVCAADYHWLDDWIKSVERRFPDELPVKDRPLVLRALARRYTIVAYMVDMKGEFKLERLESIDPALFGQLDRCQETYCYGLLAGYLNALIPALEACATRPELAGELPGVMHDQVQIARTVYAYRWCEGLDRQREYRVQQSQKLLAQRGAEKTFLGFLASLAGKAWERGAARQLVPHLARTHEEARATLAAQSWLTKSQVEGILREAFPKP